MPNHNNERSHQEEAAVDAAVDRAQAEGKTTAAEDQFVQDYRDMNADPTTANERYEDIASRASRK